MTRRIGLAAAVLCLVAVTTERVQAGLTITFESAPSTFTSYTESGVTFTAVGGGSIITALDPNGTNGILGDASPRQQLRADIAGGATSVAVDLGDFDADADTLFLQIYGASNNLLGSTTQLISIDFTGMKTLSLSAPGIAYAVFGATAPAVNGSSVYADNFTLEPGVPAVPEPSTMISGCIAALAGLFYGWRRRKAKLA